MADEQARQRERGRLPAHNPDTAVFNPAAGRLPSPDAMAAYAAIDPSYPLFLKETFTAELARNYRYQVVALVAGWAFGISILGGSVFLAYTGHSKMALSLMGANFLGLATRILTKGATRQG